MASTYSLTLRGDKGSRLTQDELDGNFLYFLESGTQGPQGSAGSQGSAGPQGSTGPQGATGSGSLKTFIQVSLYDSGATHSEAYIDFSTQQNNGMSSIVSGITLESNKSYQVIGNFFIYNVANEPYSYRMKLDSSYYGIEINLGQHGTVDFSYNLNSFSTIIVTEENSSTLSFWRVTTNTTIPAMQGSIMVVEL